MHGGIRGRKKDYDYLHDKVKPTGGSSQSKKKKI